jgi:hypothetical protein
MAFQTYIFGLLKGLLPRHPIKSRAKVNNMLYPNVFRSVGELHTRPDLEKLAIEFLDDADPEVVIDATTMFLAPQFRRPGICSKTTHKHEAIC